ncbi:hypothetical protein E2C01_056500 [Portunus trituberculatus]|uniref:Uncharacterized protein n=1 Tax=Portunus trituberculatus TaxID=210409 RepID=A0A5B7H0P9_PORTR|nr:hypothetical protein [Portunus trituberculatus]
MSLVMCRETPTRHGYRHFLGVTIKSQSLLVSSPLSPGSRETAGKSTVRHAGSCKVWVTKRCTKPRAPPARSRHVLQVGRGKSPHTDGTRIRLCVAAVRRPEGIVRGRHVSDFHSGDRHVTPRLGALSSE